METDRTADTSMAILTYHAVDPRWSAPLSVAPALFAEHLDWIAENRTTVPLEDTLDRDGSIAAGGVAITFDDGFRSIAEHALPALKARGMHATVFVVGKVIDGSGGRVDWVERPPDEGLPVLDRGAIAELHQEGIAFGCHSYAHLDLTSLGYEACLEDLRRSREVLEDLLGEEVRSLAYPFGLHDEVVRRAAAGAGFRWAFAMAMPPHDDGPHGVPRVGIYPNDGIARLRMKTHAWYARIRSSSLYPALHRLRGMTRT
jgi:peptidoglycan/xylan/chitin deacetylase (PgdA/CDA1 family)